jgi:hypothetical protein
MIKIGLLLLAVTSATLLSGQVVTLNESPPGTLIVLERGACEQRCAVYRVVIFSDGIVIYEGQHFVRRSGLVKGGISPQVLARLLNDLETGGFFHLEDNYGYGNKDHCTSLDSGEPTAILTASTHGRSKTVLHNHGCAGTDSKRLTELEDKVDQAVGTAKWIK